MLNRMRKGHAHYKVSKQYSHAHYKVSEQYGHAHYKVSEQYGYAHYKVSEQCNRTHLYRIMPTMMTMKMAPPATPAMISTILPATADTSG